MATQTPVTHLRAERQRPITNEVQKFESIVQFWMDESRYLREVEPMIDAIKTTSFGARQSLMHSEKS